MQSPGSIRYWVFFEKGLLAVWGREYSECEYSGKSVYGRSCPVVFLNQGDIRKSYVNSQITQEGGAHVEGLMKGVRRTLKRILEEYGNKLMPGDVLEYLNYVVHLRIEKPRWCGSTKTRLKNLEVKLAVEKQVEEQKYVFL
ncbi:hypothetical protein DXB04_28465 [Enterocloster bolteae]|nr:hypothetical protein DXB04_28465 [Enterocloster bolteae]